MKNFFRNVLTITVPAVIVFLLLLELFFKFIVPSAYPPMAYFDEVELIYHHFPNQRGLMTFGSFAQQKAKYRINNHGWNSPIDYDERKQKTRIAVIGDSYIEAFQVDTEKSYPSLLREKVKNDFDVYSFGKSGAPFSEYLHFSRYVNQRYRPDILIFNIVHNDFNESIASFNPQDSEIMTLKLNAGSISERIPAPNYSFQQYNWKKRLIMKSALIRYLFFNLKMKGALVSLKNRVKTLLPQRNIQAGIIYNANVEVNKVLAQKHQIEMAVDYIIGKIKEENSDKKVIFVMDAPRSDIYKNAIESSNLLFLHHMMEKYCAKYDIDLLDLTLPMKEDYRTNQTRFESENEDRKSVV